MDMLALVLALANVGANAEVLVLDMLGGLLTASVAERLGGNVVPLVDFGTVSEDTKLIQLFIHSHKWFLCLSGAVTRSVLHVRGFIELNVEVHHSIIHEY